MSAGRPARENHRPPLGAKASATLQRWPSRNYFAELAPSSSAEPHPIDMMLEQEPHLRRVARRAGRLLGKIQEQANPALLLEFEAERTLLDTARIESAFNLGFEDGLVLGRAQGLRHSARRRDDKSEKNLMADLCEALVTTRTCPRRTAVLLLELTWALALGPDAEWSSPRPKVPVSGQRSWTGSSDGTSDRLAADLRPNLDLQAPSRQTDRRPVRRRARRARGRSGS